MISFLAFALCFHPGAPSIAQPKSSKPKIQLPVLTPKRGLVITKSCRLKPGKYDLFVEEDLLHPAITIKGSNIVVDGTGVIFEGSPMDEKEEGEIDGPFPPDLYKGLAIQVSPGKNITLKGLTALGYKVGVMAKSVSGLKVVGCDLSYNWRQHLLSTLDREDESDWMSYHQNEKDEWLRYGAGIYLRDCKDFEVASTTIQDGQCGLMMTNCTRGKIWNNDFSFLSGIGLGMFRSSDNRIMHNKIDWCVRGFSYGKYNRGQDSAGILVYEQSNRNTFAYNSVTHGGDGFFLWAGQTTMDSGEGGCNDNLLYGNDFSHAPTNGIEATFSRNTFANNLVMECWHGIWGGYSFSSRVLGNTFAYNSEGIAWEHGQDNVIEGNSFIRDGKDLVIWSNATQDPNWGYAKKRDTRSRSWLIDDNRFSNTNGPAINLRRSQDLAVLKNTFTNCEKVLDVASDVTGFAFKDNRGTAANAEPAFSGNAINVDPKVKPLSPANSLNQGDESDSVAYANRFAAIKWNPMAKSSKSYIAPMPGGQNPFLKPGQPRGWRFMMVDEWGPYDFKSPIAWLRGEKGGKLQFEVLGPRGSWEVKNLIGVKQISAQEGSVPGRFEVTVEPGKAQDIHIVLEYRGAAITTRFGTKIPAGEQSEFSYSKFFAPIDWTVNWYSYDKNTQEPRSQWPAFMEMLKNAKPIKTEKVDRLDYAWPGAIGPNLPSDYFATIAEGNLDVAPGMYTLNVTSDDGVRVYVDGHQVIDNWAWHAPTLDQVYLKLTGKHKIRVEHFEIDGYSTLKVELVPKR